MKSNKNEINILVQNIRCVKNKLNDIENVCVNEKSDVILITEHWQQLNNLETLNLPGYSLGNHFSRSNPWWSMYLC